MRKSKIKNVRVMIGSGEHFMFITVPKGEKSNARRWYFHKSRDNF